MSSLELLVDTKPGHDFVGTSVGIIPWLAAVGAGREVSMLLLTLGIVFDVPIAEDEVTTFGGTTWDAGDRNSTEMSHEYGGFLKCGEGVVLG